MTEEKEVVCKGFSRYSVFRDCLPEVTVFDNKRGLFISPYKIFSNRGKPCERKYWAVTLFDDEGKRHSVVYVSGLLAKAFIPNSEGKKFVDHINNNSLDNQIFNLRWATRAENNQNIGVTRRNKTTGFKNISLTKYGKYRVKVRSNNVIHQKYLSTLEEAKILAKRWRKKYHKKFSHN
jgi:hypothetical protein